MDRRFALFSKGTRLARQTTFWVCVAIVRVGLANESPAMDPSVAQPMASESKDAIGAELEFAHALARAASGDVEAAISSLDSSKSGDVAELYAKAMWLLEKDQIEEGAELLEQIRDGSNPPSDTRKYLATAYLHLGKVKAANEIIHEYLVSHPDDKYAIFIRGLAEARLDDPNSANASFQTAGFTVDEAKQIQLAAMQIPVDAQQRLLTTRQLSDSQLYRSRVPNRAQPNRPLSFSLMLGNEFDSNVPLRPFFSGLGSNFDHEDARFVTAAFADLSVVDRDDLNVGLLASTYNTFQYELSQFNINDFMGGAYTNRLLTNDWMSSLRYEFHSTLVDGSQFSNDHRLTPSLTRLQGFGHTTAYFEYNPNDIRAPALIPAHEQTADIYRLGFTQAVYTFGGDGRIYGGYQFAEAFAQGTDFDRQSHMVTGRIECPLTCSWIWDIDARYFFDQFKSPNSLDFYDRARDDTRLELRTGLQKNFKSPVSLRIDYTYIDNDSNTENLFGVRFYDYDRHVLSTQLIFALR